MCITSKRQATVPSLTIDESKSTPMNSITTFIDMCWLYKFGFGLMIVIPLLMAATILYEGTTCVLRYRFYFLKAPVPKSPVFGVVVATTTTTTPAATITEESIDTTTTNTTEKYTQLPHVNIPHSFKVYRGDTQAQHKALTVALLTEEKPPLRILVMGDSIASGVGVTKSCTPVLPETVAKVVSKKMGGRPVFWTSLAEAGVSTSWIVKQVENHITTTAPMEEPPDISNMNDQEKWIHLLQYHEYLHYSTPLGDYDVVLLFNGVNDVKRLILPFMSFAEDDLKNEQPSIMTHLPKTTAADRFRHLIERVMDGLGQTKTTTAATERHPEQLSLSATTSIDYGSTVSSGAMMMMSSSSSSDDEKVDIEINGFTNNGHDGSRLYNNSTRSHTKRGGGIVANRGVFPKPRRRIVVMAIGAYREMMKNVASVISQQFAIFITGLMEREKKKVADVYQNVFSASPPTDQYATDYLQNHGELVNALNENDVILSLISMNANDCLDLEQRMKMFHSTFPKRDGNSLWAADLIHPSDRGYDFFGRHLGLEVAKKL